jgi:hypothetical protein
MKRRFSGWIGHGDGDTVGLPAFIAATTYSERIMSIRVRYEHNILFVSPCSMLTALLRLSWPEWQSAVVLMSSGPPPSEL